jgi:YidC/Oxa1 family membrane protein insertase
LKAQSVSATSANKKQRTWILVAVLLLAAVVLAGCGNPSGISMENPNGLWQQVVVYLAKLLMTLNNFLAGLGIRYSWGWAIIVFTIIVKIVTLPLTLKQLQSTKAQQQLQPKMREIQEKYGKDRSKLAEEQMKLYKEYGVNPMGGCLPLLIQLPILWALYQSLYVLANPNLEGGLQGARWFWIPNLAFPSLEVGTKWIGEAFQAQDWAMLFAYFSLPVLMLVTQLLVQKMAQPAKSSGQTQDPQARMMNQMMFFMPIMFAWITLGLPSGLTLYWTVSNILALVQQYFVTGWGALADWFPFLSKGQQPALAGASASAGSSTSSRSSTAAGATAGSAGTSDAPVRAVSETPEKPVKRRKRRR